MLIYFRLPILLLCTFIGTGRCGVVQNSIGKLHPFGKPMLKEFLLADNFSYLNHGAFGTFPKVVLNALHESQKRTERHPDLWLFGEARTQLAKIREMLSKIVHADPEDLVLIPNTTYGISSILRGIIFALGERILTFSTTFVGIRSLVQYIVDQSNHTVTELVFKLNFPIKTATIVENFEQFLKNNQDPKRPIRLAIVDHIISTPGAILPVEKLIALLKQYKIPILIDGAHSIGQIPFNITALDVDYYITNCHKWLFTVRGFSLMFVKKVHQPVTHPLQISFNYASPSNFQEEFLWPGTSDYNPYMTVPAALQFIQDAGGLEKINKYNHNLIMEGANKVASFLKTEVLQSEENQIGNMADVTLPIDNPQNPKLTTNFWLNIQLYKYNTSFVKIYKHNEKWCARLSAQIYNEISDFELVARNLMDMSKDANNL